MKRHSLLLTLFVLISLIFSLIAAQTPDAPSNSTQLANPLTSAGNSLPQAPRGQARTDAASIIAMLLLCLIGLGYCFYGFHLFQPTLFITGFMLFSNLASFALLSSKVMGPNPSMVVVFGIVFLAGFLGGFLLMCCWGIGVMVIGVVGGIMLANIILAAAGVTVFWIKILLCVILSIVGSILIHYFERPIIIIATSLVGSYLAIVGVDMVVNRGIAYDLQYGRGNEGISSASIWETVAVFVLAAIGAAFQLTKHHGVFGGARRGGGGHTTIVVQQQQPAGAYYPPPAYGHPNKV